MYYQRYSNGGNYFWIFFLAFLMLGGFRLLLVLFGLALAIVVNFFPLIIMGALALRFVKKVGRNRSVNASLNTKSPEHKRFVEIMVHILIHIAKADGRISSDETQMIRQFFIAQLRFSGGANYLAKRCHGISQNVYGKHDVTCSRIYIAVWV